jgi:hypothetical protein
MIDRVRTSEDLRALVIAAFHLELIDQDGVYELYRPRL